MQRRTLLGLLFSTSVALFLVACSGANLRVVAPPSRRLGGRFTVKEVQVDERLTGTTARADAAWMTAQLRGALGYVSRDGAGDEQLVVEARIVGYGDAMIVAADVLDAAGKRLARIEVSAEGSERGWTAAARETARYDCVEAIVGFMLSNR